MIQAVAKAKLHEVVKGALPFALIMLSIAVLLWFWPGLALILRVCKPENADVLAQMSLVIFIKAINSIFSNQVIGELPCQSRDSHYPHDGFLQ